MEERRARKPDLHIQKPAHGDSRLGILQFEGNKLQQEAIVSPMCWGRWNWNPARWQWHALKGGEAPRRPLALTTGRWAETIPRVPPHPLLRCQGFLWVMKTLVGLSTLGSGTASAYTCQAITSSPLFFFFPSQKMRIQLTAAASSRVIVQATKQRYGNAIAALNSHRRFLWWLKYVGTHTHTEIDTQPMHCLARFSYCLNYFIVCHVKTTNFDGFYWEFYELTTQSRT